MKDINSMMAKNKDILASDCVEYDLSIPFQDYFLLSVFRYLYQKESVCSEVLLVSKEDNAGVRDFCKNKDFLEKVFAINKNGVRYVLRVCIESNGVFKSIHDEKMINFLIWGIDPEQNYISGFKFEESGDSVHFVYDGKVEGGINEIVILSIQSSPI